MNNDLISRSALKEVIYSNIEQATKVGILVDGDYLWRLLNYAIDNAPTVKVPENEVNCVLTMFGECSYNKTGCSDCEIKEKIRKALNERNRLTIKAYRSGYENCKKDVIHSIAKQYSEHNELVPSWLHIGNMREADNEQ